MHVIKHLRTHKMTNLSEILGHNPSESEIAGHFADSISAQEQLQRIARQEGDLNLLQQATEQILSLRSEAMSSGLNPSKYSMIFRSG